MAKAEQRLVRGMPGGTSRLVIMAEARKRSFIGILCRRCGSVDDDKVEGELIESWTKKKCGSFISVHGKLTFLSFHSAPPLSISPVANWASERICWQHAQSCLEATLVDGCVAGVHGGGAELVCVAARGCRRSSMRHDDGAAGNRHGSFERNSSTLRLRYKMHCRRCLTMGLRADSHRSCLGTCVLLDLR